MAGAEPLLSPGQPARTRSEYEWVGPGAGASVRQSESEASEEAAALGTGTDAGGFASGSDSDYGVDSEAEVPVWDRLGPPPADDAALRLLYSIRNGTASVVARRGLLDQWIGQTA